VSRRLPIDLVLLALKQEAQRTGDDRYRTITPEVLRQWKVRGHLSKGHGYNLIELTDYLDRRFGAPSAAVSA
jgi:hypothetical protein